MRSVKRSVKKKVKVFGRSIPVLAIVAIVASAGLVSAAVVNYLSNTVTQPVEVKSPIELSGAITYDNITGYVSGSPETFNVPKADLTDDSPYNNVNAHITKTDKLEDGAGTVEFKVAIWDTAPHYGMGIAISTDIDTIDFQVWYAEYLDAADWYYQEYPWSDNPAVLLADLGTGITATGTREKRVFAVDIPIDLLGGEGATYYYAIQFRTKLLGTYPGIDLWTQTNASEFAVATVGEPVREPTTVPFDGTMDLALHGGDEFSMDFKATNLANTPIEAPLALVMKCPLGSVWTADVAEIEDIDPVQYHSEVSADGGYLVLVFDLGEKINPSEIREQTIKVLLAPNAEPGDYTIAALVVSSIDELVGDIIIASGL